MLNTLEYQQPEHRSETPSRRVHRSKSRLNLPVFWGRGKGSFIVHHSAFIIVVYSLLSLCFAMPAFAQQPTADDINAVASNLTCPTCTGINVADCPTETCVQWRAKIGEMLAQGYSQQEILDYFAARYGDHVLQVPPARGFFQWLWLLPTAATILGLALLAYLVRSWSRQPAPAPLEGEDQVVEDEYLQRVEQDLEGWTE